MTDPTGVTLTADGEPGPLAFLIRRLRKLVDGVTGTLATTGDVDAWQESMESLLTRYHAAAMLAAYDGADEAGALDVAKGYAAKQLAFLARFARVVEDTEYQAGYASRARMYAESIGASYWAGATQLLPLPAMPKDGTTQCRTNCKCRWSIEELDGEGNYNCTWVVSAGETCQTCTARGRRWAPLKIRGGELV